MNDLALAIRPELASDADAIERLHERAFGPGRFARTAFRLREDAPVDARFSFTALVGTLIVGSVRVTPVAAGGQAALMLGPLTVDPAFEGRGIGAALMEKAIAAAQATEMPIILLVGDEAYYRRFGFKIVPRGQLRLPGPVDPARFLVRELRDGALAGITGEVRPARRGLNDHPRPATPAPAG